MFLFLRWYILEVITNPKFNDSMQANAAGVVEADLTTGDMLINANQTSKIENFIYHLLEFTFVLFFKKIK